MADKILSVFIDESGDFGPYDAAAQYDNGQVDLTKILSSVFNVLYPNVKFRKVRPVDYRLFQVAD